MVKQGKLPLDEGASRLNLSVPEDEQEPVADNDDSIVDQPLSEEEAEVQLSVGEHLKRERERQGLSLHDIAERLRIRPKQLQALEDADYDNLPGQTFVAGFIRSYATSLGLDAVAVVELYKSEHDLNDQVPNLAFPEPTSEGKIPGSGLLAATALIAILVFAGWYFYLKDSSLDLEKVPELPDRLISKLKGEENNPVATSEPSEVKTEIESPLVTTDSPAVLETTAEQEKTESPITETESAFQEVASTEAEKVEAVVAATEETAVEAAADQTTVSETPAVVAEATPTPSAQTPVAEEKKEEVLVATESETAVAVAPETTPEVVAPVQAEKTETPKFEQLTLQTVPNASDLDFDLKDDEVALGVENVGARLVILSRQEGWVQVVNASGAIVLDRIMSVGDTFMVPDEPGMKLNLANASGVELRLDGSPLKSLGGYGKIVRDLSLNPEQLLEKFGKDS